MLTLSNIFKRSEKNLVVREIAGETLLVPISGQLADLERIFTLNDVGKFIWTQLDGNTNIETVLSRITEEFAVDRETAQTDLYELISDFMSAGLVKQVSDVQGGNSA